MTTKRTMIADLKPTDKTVTVRGVITDIDFSRQWDAGMYEPPDYGWILTDETGSIQISPFHAIEGYEYTISGEVIDMGGGNLIIGYQEKHYTNEKPNLQLFQNEFQTNNPSVVNPFSKLVNLEHQRQEQRKTLIISAVIIGIILIWWFAIYRGGPATAICNDGWTSHSHHHSGTCSDHGGVQQWLDTSTGSSGDNTAPTCDETGAC